MEGHGGADMSVDPAVAELRKERDGYVARGLWNRVAQVDVQLAKLGVDVDGAAHVDDESASPTSASETTEAAPVTSVVEEAGGSSVRRKSGRRAG